MKYVDKKYIYIRDNQKCFHCGKKLEIKKVTLDHYFPRSKGGTYDVFNLVTSCKNCNKYKKSIIPKDYNEIQIKLFIEAIRDKKILLLSSIRINYNDLVILTKAINHVKRNEEYTIFESDKYKFYVKRNKIFRLEKKC